MSKCILVLIKVVMLLGYSHCSVTKKAVHMPPEVAGAIFVAVQKCQPETGIGADTLLLIYEGKYREDEQFKSFIFCSYKSAGFLRDDGYIDEDKAIEPFKNEPLVVEGIKRCSQENGGNAKESLFKFFKCFTDTAAVQLTL